jgi:hypothetical protein
MPSRLFSVDPIEPGQHVFVFSKSRNEVFAPVSNGYPTRTEAIAGLNFNLEAETFEMTASG